MVDVFSSDNLREPPEAYIERIEKKFREVGFNGYIGAVDSIGWDWKNYPKEMQDSFVEKGGVLVLISEVLFDLDIWICSFQFGIPGVFKEVGIFSLRENFGKMLNGEVPPVAPNFKIGNGTLKHLYYLEDDIYHSWKFFCKHLSEPESEKEQLFSKEQEEVKKCVEMAFGVFFTQLKMVSTPRQLGSSEEMGFYF